MTLDELKRFMSAIAASDRRTTSKADVDFWAAMAHEGRWTLGTSMRSLIQFRATRPGDWLEPGHISAIVRDARRKAAESFVVTDAPDDITGRDYPTWYRTQLTAHIARVLHAWAAGEPIPEPSAALDSYRQASLTVEPDTSTCPSELRERIARDIANAGRERPPLCAPQGLPYRPLLDPDRREQARVELDAIRPTQAPQEAAEQLQESAS